MIHIYSASCPSVSSTHWMTDQLENTDWWALSAVRRLQRQWKHSQCSPKMELLHSASSVRCALPICARQSVQCLPPIHHCCCCLLTGVYGPCLTISGNLWKVMAGASVSLSSHCPTGSDKVCSLGNVGARCRERVYGMPWELRNSSILQLKDTELKYINLGILMTRQPTSWNQCPSSEPSNDPAFKEERTE